MVVSREQHIRFELTPFASRHQIALEREGFEILSNHLQEIFPQGFRFSKEPIDPHSQKSPYRNQVVIDRRLSIEQNGGQFIIERVQLNGNGRQKNGRLTNNALLNFLLKSAHEQRQSILEYLKGKDTIICLRRVGSSNAFHEAYKLHSDTFDAGYAPVTEALAILLTMDEKSCIGLPSEQIRSFQRLQELSSTSVHFIPLTNNEDIIEMIEQLNQKADPLEIIHDIHIAQSEINDSETKMSIGFATAGGVTGTLLENVSDGVAAGLGEALGAHIPHDTATKVGKGTAMVIAHEISELFAILQSRADTFHIPSLNSREIVQFIKQSAISFAKLTPQAAQWLVTKIRDLSEQARQNNEIKQTLALTFIPIILGSTIASATGFLPAFFAIAPFNAWLINARELRRRRKKIDEELGDYSSCIEFIDSFLKARYPILSNIPYIKKSIARRLAIVDLASSNKPAIGSLIGNTLAFPLMTFYASQPESSRLLHLTDEFIYAISAIMTEQVAGIIAGGFGKVLKPWDKFSSFMQIIDQLRLPINHLEATSHSVTVTDLDPHAFYVRPHPGDSVVLKNEMGSPNPPTYFVERTSADLPPNKDESRNDTQPDELLIGLTDDDDRYRLVRAGTVGQIICPGGVGHESHIISSRSLALVPIAVITLASK